jgi:hypothetical protein
MPKIAKNVLSQYLRTKCDRQLRLSLYTDAEQAEMGWPVRLNARPAVQILRDRGLEWEAAKLLDLEIALPDHLVGKKEDGRYRSLDLSPTLRGITSTTTLILQGKFGDPRLSPEFLRQIGVSDEAIHSFPKFSAFQPDILLVQPAPSATELVLPSGKVALVRDDDQRSALSLCDIKHAGEANSSYSAELAFYAVLLSNWLVLEGLDRRFFVSAKMGLWTRAKEKSTIAELVASNPKATLLERISSFLHDWEVVDFETYFQTVEHFFRSDLPRVMAVNEWSKLDWHVDSRCSNCDFLGYVPWLGAADRERLNRNRSHYCVPAAQDNQHLSRIATLTRGSRKTLEDHGHRTVGHVAALSRDHNVFEQHNGLRADRVHLPHRAAALAERDSSLSEGTVTIDFPKWADLEVFVTVNFDPGTGLLTALGSEGRFRQRTPFGVQNEIRRTWPIEAQVLLDATSTDERNSLLAFLSRIAEIFEFIHDRDPAKGGALASKTRCHFYFWDERQFDELTRAVGRHLPTIVASGNDKFLRGLVWLFPPEQLLATEELVLAHPVSSMKRIIQRDVRLPVPHSLTLFNVATAYHGESTPSVPGSYYRDPFSDMIPRERIYEIWAKEPLIKLGRSHRTLAQCITDYSDAVKKQVGALRNVVWKFRDDMQGRLPRDARSIELKTPFNFQDMSEDGRLWLAWVKLDEACKSIEIHRGWMAEPEELEASYEILRFKGLLSEDGNRATFAVAPGSRDCKFRETEGFLTLRIESKPGILDQLVADAGRGHPTLEHIHIKVNRALEAKLVSFDRDQLRAVVEFSDYRENAEARRELRNCGIVDFTDSVGLVKGMGVDFSKRVHECVIALQRPAIAIAAVETYNALGHARDVNPPRHDPVTPAASVLWDGRAVAAQQTNITDILVDDALVRIRAIWTANPSQIDAIRHCLKHRLNLVWGPPGTGKTKTAAAHVVARVIAARAANRPIRVLITGPTYTAVEKLFSEACALFVSLDLAELPFFRIYSAGRTEGSLSIPGVTCRDIALKASPSFNELKNLLANRTQTVLVGTVIHQCYQLAKSIDRGATAKLFDLIVMDESSQIDVSHSLFALSLLADNFELALFGDHLQMPPVTLTQPPKGAEWLVGSIQTYLLQRHQIRQQPLLINYRSSQPFVDFARHIHYPAELCSHSPGLSLHLLAPVVRPTIWSGSIDWFEGLAEIVDPAKALTAVTYADGRAGQANHFEADLVCCTVQQLFASVSGRLDGRRDGNEADVAQEHSAYTIDKFWKQGVGIVSPHRAQRSVIVRKLSAIFPAHPRSLIDAAVDTVERFQGGERDTIIISFGVGDPDLIATEEEFLLKLERTNVAISRARAKCILFISDDLAYHLPTERAVVETARAVKCFVNTICRPRVSTLVPLASGNRQIQIRN